MRPETRQVHVWRGGKHAGLRAGRLTLVVFLHPFWLRWWCWRGSAGGTWTARVGPLQVTWW